MKNITILLVILMLAPWHLSAQESTANTRFYEGVMAEEVTGDLDKALTIYQDLIKTNPKDRILSAKCLYHIGLTYEKKGSDKAIGYFSDVLEKYPDQSDLAELARGRIAKLKDANTFIDPRDGHKYRWVKIGNQIWMAENLAYMPHVNPPKKQEDGIWVYDYDGEDVAEAKATENYQKYGCLYDWAMAMDIDTKYLEQPWNGNSEMHQGICPPGWHLPTDGEWKVLEKALGMPDSLANAEDETRARKKNIFTDSPELPPVGKYLKSASGWYLGGNGDNSSGMAMLPAGERQSRVPRAFVNLGYSCYYWTATDTSYLIRKGGSDSCYSAYNRYLSAYWPYDVSRELWYDRREGYSVRCLKENVASPVNGVQPLASIKSRIIEPRINVIVSESTIKPQVYKILPNSDETNQKNLIGPSPLIDGKTIYMAQPNSSIILAINALTLDTLWAYDAGVKFLNNVFLTSDNVLIFSTKDKTVGIGKLDGKIKWQTRGGFFLEYCRVQNEILFGQAKDSLIAIGVDDGKEIWSCHREGTMFYYPTIHENLIFCPLFIREVKKEGVQDNIRPIAKSNLLALNVNTGDKVWEIKDQGTFWDCVYSNGLVIFPAQSTENGNYLHAVDAATGQEKWKLFINNSGVNLRTALADSMFFQLSSGHSNYSWLLALKKTGRLIWKTRLTNVFRLMNRTPVLYDNKIFFLGDSDRKGNKLIALDTKTGTHKYIFELPVAPITYPVFLNNKMYIGCKDGLYVFDYPKVD